jgi:hypothetical protein
MVVLTRAEGLLSTPQALIEVSAKYQVPGYKFEITYVSCPQAPPRSTHAAAQACELFDQTSYRLGSIPDRPEAAHFTARPGHGQRYGLRIESKPINRTCPIAGSHLYAALRRDSSRFKA